MNLWTRPLVDLALNLEFSPLDQIIGFLQAIQDPLTLQDPLIVLRELYSA